MARTTLHGIAVSAGISIGKAFFMNRHHYHLIPRQTVAPALIPAELIRLEQAFESIKKEFESARSKVPPDLKEHAAIIETHLMICNDPKLLGSAKRIVEQVGITAEWALEKAMAEIEEAFNAIEVPYIRDRFQDISLVADRVQAKLLGETERKQGARNLEGRVVLMAHDLTPGDTIELDVNKIMSFATVQGGKTSHTGILARSLRIPALVGVTNLEESVTDGDLVVIDGLKGKVVVEPDEEELTYYADLKYRFESYHKGIIRSCRLPGETLDGYRMDVLANVELDEEIPSVLENGGEGIGLFRTEYAFLNRLDTPEEEELYNGYRKIAETMAPGWVVFRTLDVGADKIMAGAESLEETNPAMGLRAIRYCLKNTDLFMRQLRAILRASAVGNVALMFPMISGLHEVLEAKRYLEQAQRELHAKRQKFNPYMPVGIMIELPSAGDHRRGPGPGGGFLQHRHQRPHPVLPGHRPHQQARLLPLPAPAPGRAAQHQTRGGRGPPSRHRGERLRRGGLGSLLFPHPHGHAGGRHQHHPPGHPRHQAHHPPHHPGGLQGPAQRDSGQQHRGRNQPQREGHHLQAFPGRTHVLLLRPGHGRKLKSVNPMAKTSDPVKLIARNKQVRREFELLEFFEAGLVLTGSEVKSLRAGQISFKDGYVRFKNDGAWLMDVHIAPYENAGHDGHEPERPRKLLLHSREIAVLTAKVEQKGLTVVPVRLYLKNGKSSWKSPWAGARRSMTAATTSKTAP